MKRLTGYISSLRRAALGLSVFAAALQMTSLSASALTAKELEAAANKEGSVFIYTSNVDALMKVIAPAFEKEYPGVKVSFIRLSSSTVFSRFTAEVGAGVVQADLLWTASTQLYQERPELFRELTTAVVPNLNIESSLHPKNKNYVVVSVSTHNVTYNTNLVSKNDLETHLATWKDLADPRWKGKIALVDPRGSASVSSFLHLLEDTYGADWLAAFGKQVKLIDRASSGAQQAAAGAFQLVVPSDMSHSAELRVQNAPVAAWSPAGPAHGLEHSMAIPKLSSHPAAAALFVNWALSPSGQTVLCGLNMAATRAADPKCDMVSEKHVSPRDSVPDDKQEAMVKQLGL